MCECICEQILFRVWMDVWATTLDEMRKLSSISEIPAANVAHLLRRTNTNFVSNYNFCQSIWLYWSTEPRKQHFLTIRWKFEWKRHQLAMLIETKFQTVGWSVQKVSVHRLNGILVRCLNFMFKARLEAFFWNFQYVRTHWWKSCIYFAIKFRRISIIWNIAKGQILVNRTIRGKSIRSTNSAILHICKITTMTNNSIEILLYFSLRW